MQHSLSGQRDGWSHERANGGHIFSSCKTLADFSPDRRGPMDWRGGCHAAVLCHGPGPRGNVESRSAIRTADGAVHGLCCCLVVVNGVIPQFSCTTDLETAAEILLVRYRVSDALYVRFRRNPHDGEPPIAGSVISPALFRDVLPVLRLLFCFQELSPGRNAQSSFIRRLGGGILSAVVFPCRSLVYSAQD